MGENKNFYVGKYIPYVSLIILTKFKAYLINI